MKRKEIERSLTWDLSAMFPDKKAFERECGQVKELLQKAADSKGHIADSMESFIGFMELLEELYRQLDNVSCYANMCADVEPEDDEVQERLAAASHIEQEATVTLAFYEQEMIEQKERIKQWLKEEACADFRYPISEIFRTIPHRKTKEIEEIMAQYQDIVRAPSDAYSSFRVEFEPVMVDGKPQFLNGGTYRQFLLHPKKEVREQAFVHYHREYERYQNLFMNLLSAHAKGQVLAAKLRNFPGALEASLFEDGAERSLYEKVLYMANEKHHGFLHEYFSLRKKLLHMEQQHVYDITLPLIEDTNISYTIDECFTILKKALAPLGEDYTAMLDVARKERWIDFLPHEGKRSGAYSSGTHDSKPYILTNFTGSYDSLSTLAHEFGHSMHSYYSHTQQRPLLSGYRIFVAEVASTVNELLLNEYLLKTSKDPALQAELLNNLMTQLIGTLYRQPMYARFESRLHEWIEEGTPVSSKQITQFFLDINKEYFGEGVEVDDLYRYNCYSIPHFYYNFYVYKYSLGMAVAIAFTKRILKGDVQAYRSFLAKGGSEAPIDELIHAGVDPQSDAVYDEAFTYFKEILERFKQLML